MPAAGASHAALMDGVYRYQRHIYDLTRKYYLLGRDRLIARLQPPRGGTVLEIGCGTGRNLVLAARRHPEARFFGLDISSHMLETAGDTIARSGLRDRIALALADATSFESESLFGRQTFDRVYLSYAVSMIPDWQAALRAAIDATAPHGSLHVVDFGQQENLPRWFKAMLHGWLARFHVTPRADLGAVMRRIAATASRECRIEPIFGGYAWLASIGPVKSASVRAAP